MSTLAEHIAELNQNLTQRMIEQHDLRERLETIGKEISNIRHVLSGLHLAANVQAPPGEGDNKTARGKKGKSG